MQKIDYTYKASNLDPRHKTQVPAKERKCIVIKREQGLSTQIL